MRVARYILLALWMAIAPAQATTETPPLTRGLNLSSWLANAPRQPLDARDFKRIAAAGFDHVRLPVNPEFFGFSLTTPTTMDLTPVDRAIAMARHERLAVILDLHPNAAFKTALENDPQAAARFAQLWGTIARHYRAIPASELAFELLNEPGYYRATKAYRRFAQTLIAAIRAEDATRLIIVAAPEGSSLAGLEKLTPLEGTNLAYDVHFYEPYLITHQGIAPGFEKTMLRYFHGVPYPADRVAQDALVYAGGAPNAAQAQGELDDYIAQRWNAERIAQRLKRAKDWADMHRVRLICSEFGVFRTHIDAASRYRWITDVRTALDAYGIGWALWDYTDIFGITEGPDRRIEPAALQALGLP